jgi:hypothetical protein
VINHLEAILVDDCLLQSLDFFVEEFDHVTGLDVDQIVVMFAVVQLEDRMAPVEVVPHHKACCLELGQDTVNRGQTDVLTSLHQRLVDVLGTHVALLGGIEHLQNLDPWKGHFEAGFA